MFLFFSLKSDDGLRAWADPFWLYARVRCSGLFLRDVGVLYVPRIIVLGKRIIGAVPSPSLGSV